MVAIGATLTALATGLGALPFLAVRQVSRSWLGAANAAAAGVMIGASIGLVGEGVDWSLWRTIFGAATGAGFVVLVRRSLPHGDGLHFGALRDESARKAVLILAIMTAHSVAEGVGVGVAYGGGEPLGLATTIAIALHNIPEGLAISLVLIPRGVSVAAAAGWSIFSSLPQPLMAVPAFILVDLLAPALPLGLGFAAGAMVWMSLVELAPGAARLLSGVKVALIIVAAGLAMVVFQSVVLGL
ncbi:MAG: ZIP family metal transporter [Thermoleophilia bacterium]|nr:ZIP family metal transporter [Thermoleophilia bacterium]MDH3725655.1 ZIP family metal transporter [Thermoleophilia bacterium]